MTTQVDIQRDLARAFWAGNEVICPRHGVPMRAAFVQTTYSDHISLDCPAGKESLTIPQRPRQMEFNPHQLEGLVVFVQQGDNVLCYRCQSNLQVDVHDEPAKGTAVYTFTCVRCLSWGVWQGRPEQASIEGVSDRIE